MLGSLIKLVMQYDYDHRPGYEAAPGFTTRVGTCGNAIAVCTALHKAATDVI